MGLSSLSHRPPCGAETVYLGQALGRHSEHWAPLAHQQALPGRLLSSPEPAQICLGPQVGWKVLQVSQEN